LVSPHVGRCWQDERLGHGYDLSQLSQQQERGIEGSGDKTNNKPNICSSGRSWGRLLASRGRVV
jgi:hypothetical protein